MNRFSGGLGKIGQSIRQQAEELNVKAKEVAKQLEEGFIPQKDAAGNIIATAGMKNDSNTKNAVVSATIDKPPPLTPTRNVNDVDTASAGDGTNNNNQSTNTNTAEKEGGSSGAPLSQRDPESVSKEELMGILLGLN
jgi:hypothetical protein